MTYDKNIIMNIFNQFGDTIRYFVYFLFFFIEGPYNLSTGHRLYQNTKFDNFHNFVATIMIHI